MSKHQKEVRRARRKAERARRSRVATGGAAALAAAAAIAAGTNAYASPVRFDNPAGAGHFDWTTTVGQHVLDVTLDATSQLGQPDIHAPSAFRKTLDAYGAGEVIDGYGVPGTHGIQAQEVGTPYAYSFLVGVTAGELIPSGAAWGGGGYVFTNNYYAYMYAGVHTLLPEGVPTYLGVRFDEGYGWQYGWIGIVRTGDTSDAFAWGYETTPDVPIAAGVPEPGSLALLAIGAAGALSRRRRD